MKRWILLSGVVSALAIFASVSRSDVPDTASPAGSAASVPAPADNANGSGSNNFPPGPPIGAIPYEAMTAPERAVIDRGRDTTGWDEVSDTFASASRELSQRSAAQAASDQLGTGDLATEGVVP